MLLLYILTYFRYQGPCVDICIYEYCSVSVNFYLHIQGKKEKNLCLNGYTKLNYDKLNNKKQALQESCLVLARKGKKPVRLSFSKKEETYMENKLVLFTGFFIGWQFGVLVISHSFKFFHF